MIPFRTRPIQAVSQKAELFKWPHIRGCKKIGLPTNVFFHGILASDKDATNGILYHLVAGESAIFGFSSAPSAPIFLIALRIG